MTTEQAVTRSSSDSFRDKPVLIRSAKGRKAVHLHPGLPFTPNFWVWL
jgi:hypothetical protein